MIFVILGLALDAAFYWRFTNMLEVFRKVPDGLNYRHYAFPRLLLVAGASIVVAWGSYYKPTNATLIIVGCAAFLIFSSYPHVDIYRRSKRLE